MKASLAFFGMEPFDSLGGHYGLQAASEVRSDLRFEISDLNCLHIHVDIAYMVLTLLMASESTMASKQPRRSHLTSDFKSMAQTTYATMLVWTVLAYFGPNGGKSCCLLELLASPQLKTSLCDLLEFFLSSKDLLSNLLFRPAEVLVLHASFPVQTFFAAPLRFLRRL